MLKLARVAAARRDCITSARTCINSITRKSRTCNSHATAQLSTTIDSFAHHSSAYTTPTKASNRSTKNVNDGVVEQLHHDIHSIERHIIGKYFNAAKHADVSAEELKLRMGEHQTTNQSNSNKTILSPTMVHTLIHDSMSSNDSKTLDLVIERCASTGFDFSEINSEQIESIMRYYMSRAQHIRAAKVLMKCDPTDIHVSNHTCSELVSALIDSCQWNHAVVVCMYMLMRQHHLPEKTMFYTVGGLMQQSAGVRMVLELLSLVLVHQRLDQAEYFSFNKLINVVQLTCTNEFLTRGIPPQLQRFSSFLHYHHHDQRHKITTHEIQPLLDLCCQQLATTQQLNFTLAKFVVAIAISNGHYETASAFITRAVDFAVAQNKAELSRSLDSTSGRTTTDVLSLLRSFAQADGIAFPVFPVASHHNNGNGNGSLVYSSVTLTLLRLIDKHATALTQHCINSTMILADLLNMHWVLAYRARHFPADVFTTNMHNSTTHLSNSSTTIDAIASAQAATVDARRMYEELRRFRADTSKKVAVYSPRSYSQRRLLRVCCDALHLQHKLVRTNPSTRRITAGINNSDSEELQFSVQVWKIPNDESAQRIEPISWDDFLRQQRRSTTSTTNNKHRALNNDNNNRFTTAPLYQQSIQAILTNALATNAATTTAAIHKHVNAMQNYANAAWALQLVEFLQQRHIPLPQGLLRNTLRMAASSHDVYAVLELLHANHTEMQRARQALRLIDNHIDTANTTINDSHVNKEYLKQLQAIAQHSATDATYLSSSLLYDLDYTHTSASVGAGARLRAFFVDHGDDDVDIDTSEVDSNISSSSASELLKMVDRLTTRDCNRACLAAFQSKTAGIPMEAYKTAFTEVLMLLRENQIELTTQSMQSLLRFLVFTHRSTAANVAASANSSHSGDSAVLFKLLQKFNDDKRINISYVENVALSYLLLGTLSVGGVGSASLGHKRLLTITQPIYRDMDYLKCSPKALSQLSALFYANIDTIGLSTARTFDHAWQQQHSRAGRQQLLQLLDSVVSDDNTPTSTSLNTHDANKSATTSDNNNNDDGVRTRERLITTRNNTARDTVVLLCLYTAYLLVSRDNMHRSAYELLYKTWTLVDAAAVYHAATNESANPEFDYDDDDDVDSNR